MTGAAITPRNDMRLDAASRPVTCGRRLAEHTKLRMEAVSLLWRTETDTPKRLSLLAEYALLLGHWTGYTLWHLEEVASSRR